MSLRIDHNEDVKAEINMTPLIDVMLVLLIIFMVSSSIALQSGLEIDIPKTSSRTKTQEAQPVVVAMDQYGRITLNGAKIQYSALAASLSQAIAQSKSKMVIFEADKRAEIGRTIEIMDLAKKSGAENFAIAAESVEKTGP